MVWKSSYRNFCPARSTLKQMTDQKMHGSLRERILSLKSRSFVAFSQHFRMLRLFQLGSSPNTTAAVTPTRQYTEHTKCAVTACCCHACDCLLTACRARDIHCNCYPPTSLNQGRKTRKKVKLTKNTGLHV